MIYERGGPEPPHDADFWPAGLGIEWRDDGRDETWMVTYADIISTSLAMVVLLFGQVTLTSAAHTEPLTRTDAGRPPPEWVGPLEQEDARSESGAEDRFASLVEARFDGRIFAEQRSEGLVLTIPEVALFASARAELADSADSLLAELARTLHETGVAEIAVEGHTDDRPVLGGVFDSNWDLAAARANAVARSLLSQGFPPQRLHSVSYADTRPVADNGTPEGRAANRRVELKIELRPERSG